MGPTDNDAPLAVAGIAAIEVRESVDAVVVDGESAPDGSRLEVGDMIDDEQRLQPAGLRRAGRRES